MTHPYQGRCTYVVGLRNWSKSGNQRCHWIQHVRKPLDLIFWWAGRSRMVSMSVMGPKDPSPHREQVFAECALGAFTAPRCIFPMHGMHNQVGGHALVTFCIIVIFCVFDNLINAPAVSAVSVIIWCRPLSGQIYSPRVSEMCFCVSG